MVYKGKEFDCIGMWHENRAKVSIDDQWGFIDLNGDYIVKPIFDTVYDFYNGCARVSINGKWGFIDLNGNYIAKPHFDNADDFQNGFANVYIYDLKIGGKIDVNGNFTSPDIKYTEGRAIVEMNGRYGYIDEKANFIVEPILKDAKNFKNGCARVYTESKDNIYDGLDLNDGWDLDDDFDFTEGCGKAKGLEYKWGYIDLNGDYIVKPRFVEAHDFNEGRALVKSNGKYGYIDNNGAYIVKPIFDIATNFYAGETMVSLNHNVGYIDSYAFIIK